MVWRPNLNSLRLFVAVCEEGSIARAAERESIVPSAISKRLAEMESQSGVPLLIREGRRFRLTPAGKALLSNAQQMLRMSERIQAELSDYAKGAESSVRLVASMSSLISTLPSDLGSYLRKRPNVRVHLVERLSAQVVRAVREGASDVGICLDSVDTQGFDLRPYESDRLIVAYSPLHELARLDDLDFSRVLNHPLVGLAEESALTRMLTDAALRLGKVINYRMHVATFEVAFQLVAENLAVCVAPYNAVQRFEKYLGLCWRILPEEWAQRRFVLCMRDFNMLDESAKSLVEHFELRAENRRANTESSL